VQWNFNRDTTALVAAQPGGAGAAAGAGGRGGRGGGGGGGGGGGRGGGGGGSVDPGTYLVTITVGGRSTTKPVLVLQDRWLAR
jgi:hypothetical protein